MEYLTPKMVGQLLHIGVNKVYKLFRLPGFPRIKIGNQMIVEKENLMNFLNEYKGSSIKLG